MTISAVMLPLVNLQVDPPVLRGAAATTVRSALSPGNILFLHEAKSMLLISRITLNF